MSVFLLPGPDFHFLGSKGYCDWCGHLTILYSPVALRRDLWLQNNKQTYWYSGGTWLRWGSEGTRGSSQGRRSRVRGSESEIGRLGAELLRCVLMWFWLLCCAGTRPLKHLLSSLVVNYNKIRPGLTARFTHAWLTTSHASRFWEVWNGAGGIPAVKQ